MAGRHTPARGRIDETSISAAFAREGLQAHRWSNDAGDVYAPHQHSYEKLLYCLSGSITFRLTASDEEFVLTAGDRLEIDAGTEHSAVVGKNGCTCIEAARA